MGGEESSRSSRTEGTRSHSERADEQTTSHRYVEIIFRSLVLLGSTYVIKCKKHFIKMLKDVGMVVPKSKETRL